MTMHNFDESLAYSHTESDKPWCGQAVRALLPGVREVVDLRADGDHQRLGRDRVAVMSTGKAVYIDDKFRKRDRPDVALEIWSAYPMGGQPPYGPAAGAVLGWAVKPSDTDYILYAWPTAGRCMLLPVPAVRVALQRNGPLWREKAQARVDGFRFAPADNDSSKGRAYQSISIVVPIPVLQAAISDAQVYTWNVDGAPSVH